MRSNIRSLLVGVAFAALSGCGGGHSAFAPAPQIARPLSADGATSQDTAPRFVQIAIVRTPDAPTGGIAVGSAGSVYLSGHATFMRYTGTFRQYRYPLPEQGLLPAVAETSDNAMTDGPGNEISVVLQSFFPPNGPGVSYIGALNPVSGHTISSKILTRFADDETIGVANAGHDRVGAMQSYFNAGSGVVTVLNTLLAATGDLSAPDSTLINTGTVGPDGAIYFGNLPTLSPFTNTLSPSRILRRIFGTTITKSVTLPKGSQVEHIAAGPDGALWFTDPGLNKIGRVTTSLAVTYYRVPTPRSGLAGITAGSDNAMWFTESAVNKIGRIGRLGTVNEYVIPHGSRPLGIAAGPAGGCIPNTIYFSVTEGLGKLAFSS